MDETKLSYYTTPIADAFWHGVIEVNDPRTSRGPYCYPILRARAIRNASGKVVDVELAYLWDDKNKAYVTTTMSYILSPGSGQKITFTE